MAAQRRGAVRHDLRDQVLRPRLGRIGQLAAELLLALDALGDAVARPVRLERQAEERLVEMDMPVDEARQEKRAGEVDALARASLAPPGSPISAMRPSLTRTSTRLPSARIALARTVSALMDGPRPAREGCSPIGRGLPATEVGSTRLRRVKIGRTPIYRSSLASQDAKRPRRLGRKGEGFRPLRIGPNPSPFPPKLASLAKAKSHLPPKSDLSDFGIMDCQIRASPYLVGEEAPLAICDCPALKGEVGVGASLTDGRSRDELHPPRRDELIEPVAIDLPFLKGREGQAEIVLVVARPRRP